MIKFLFLLSITIFIGMGPLLSDTSSCVGDLKREDHQLKALTKSELFAPNSLAYLLQAENLGNRDIAIAKLTDSGRDLIVIDYAYNGSIDGKWSKIEIDKIRSGKKGRKVVAYISIGEAEDYRNYWQKHWDKNSDGIPDTAAPTFLEVVNSNWAGNYKVHYWNKEWQKIILKYIDEIIAQGFDGIYLDIVDAFEFFEHDKKRDEWIDNRINPATGKSYRQDMINWVGEIVKHAKQKKPNFLIIPQNGSQLLSENSYLDLIDGIGVEDLFTIGNKKQSKEHIQYVLSFLKKIKKLNKPIFIIEYGMKKKIIKTSKKGVKKNGFILLQTDRQLKTMGSAL